MGSRRPLSSNNSSCCNSHPHNTGMDTFGAGARRAAAGAGTSLTTCAGARARARAPSPRPAATSPIGATAVPAPPALPQAAQQQPADQGGMAAMQAALQGPQHQQQLLMQQQALRIHLAAGQGAPPPAQLGQPPQGMLPHPVYAPMAWPGMPGMPQPPAAPQNQPGAHQLPPGQQ